MRSVGGWTRWSERSEVHRVHPPKRSSAMRSGAERVEMLPTERERQADGVSRHRTNNSAASGYLRAALCLAMPGGFAVGPGIARL